MKYYLDYQRYISESVAPDIPVVWANENGLLSFTPYISNPCSANCRFCSEKLSSGGVAAAALSVCSGYREKLLRAFLYQRGRNIFLSVSGMEPSESPAQLALVSEAVLLAEQQGCIFSDRVMYSNLSGFTKNWKTLTDLVRTLKLSRIECSRHHFDEQINQQIVRFKHIETIRSNAVFAQIVRRLQNIVSVRMVCVTQKSGVASLDDIVSYLEFARKIGVNEVVFRGLSVFSEQAECHAVASYIAENRIDMLDILRILPPDRFHLRSVTEGYYYYSFQYSWNDMNVWFEMSDYDRMIQNHNSDRQFKLIFYPNGDLCKDWNMRRKISDTEFISPIRLQTLSELAQIFTADGFASAIGSFGVWLVAPQALDHLPNDLDLFIDCNAESLKRAVSLLKMHGFDVFSWQDRIDDSFSYELLKGRFYIRGIRDGLTVDVTYEIEHIPYDSLAAHSVMVNGIYTYDIEAQIRLLEVCDRPDLLDRLERLRSIAT